jgi:hypothetical protein
VEPGEAGESIRLIPTEVLPSRMSLCPPERERERRRKLRGRVVRDKTVLEGGVIET